MIFRKVKPCFSCFGKTILLHIHDTDSPYTESFNGKFRLELLSTDSLLFGGCKNSELFRPWFTTLGVGVK